MKQFTIEQIKAAFWNTFHKQGEVWFEYISDDQYCEGTTNAHWDDFEERLTKGVNDEEEAIPQEH